MSVFLRKLRKPHIWRRLFHERFSEPVHLNVLAVLVQLFGTYRAKIAFDLVIRQHNAYSILACADQARAAGLGTVSLVEFGVSAGAGLMNMAEIAARVSRITGVQFKLYGFDTGTGMPPPVDYRDHPDLYQQGDFPMDVAALEQALPANARLVLGHVADTIQPLLAALPDDEPIGYVVFDLDYYSSTKDALAILGGRPTQYLPLTHVYLDDIYDIRHNRWCGELLAVQEFNESSVARKIDQWPLFETTRIFRRPVWLKHMYQLHVLDHPARATIRATAEKVRHENPYLR